MLLPVPKLDETIKKYKNWIKPLLSEEEYKNSLEIADDFLINSAEKLQELLLEEKEIYTNTSWLYQHWIDSYLCGREVVSIGSNFAMDLKFDSENLDYQKFLPCFIKSLGEVCKIYKNGNFGKVFDAKNNEISLNQFEILKGSSRIPKKNQDIYNISDKNSNYITVFYKNNLFKIEIFDENNQMKDTENAILEIINNTKKQEFSLSTICFTDSDKAAELREKYISKNVFFNVIENSLFNLTIIDENMENIEDERYKFLYLNGENTWLFKPLNFIYNLSNKKIYINCEHTYQDAGTIIEILKRAYKNMESISKIKGIEAKSIKIKEYFDDNFMKIAGEIKKEYKEKIENFFCKDILLEISEEKLKGHSKDAIMQFLLQYAQLKTFGEIRGMYEAVDMREYQYGRTECVRSVSSESVEFIKSLINSDKKEEILNKLEKAEIEHKNRIKECKKANGVDRHLYGLYLMIEKLESDIARDSAKTFFNDISYKKVTENFLSTTSTGLLEHMGYLLFTPVVEKGLGITYLKEEEGIKYLISYYRSEEKKVDLFIKKLYEGINKLEEIL